MGMSVSNCYPIFVDDNSEEPRAADQLLACQRACVQPVFDEVLSPLPAQILRASGDSKLVRFSNDFTSPFITNVILSNPNGVDFGGYLSVYILCDPDLELRVTIREIKIIFFPKEGIRMPKRAS